MMTQLRIVIFLLAQWTYRCDSDEKGEVGGQRVTFAGTFPAAPSRTWHARFPCTNATHSKVWRKTTMISVSDVFVRRSCVLICLNNRLILRNIRQICEETRILIGNAWKTFGQSLLLSALSDRLCLFGYHAIACKER
jgi:hypothetical protein